MKHLLRDIEGLSRCYFEPLLNSTLGMVALRINAIYFRFAGMMLKRISYVASGGSPQTLQKNSCLGT